MPRRVVPVITLIVLASCSNAPTAPTAPTPTPEGPSQTAAEAKRDGVPAKVAAMTLSERTRLPEITSPSITSDEGVWTITRPGVVPEYGEVLLLDTRRERVIEAFPLPGAPPYLLALTKDAVYCARTGDGGLPNTTVCRIDRRTNELTGRVFWCTDCVDSTLRPKPPSGWSVTEGALEIYELVADDEGVWAKSYKKGWTRLDPKTLQIVATNVARPTATPS